MTSSLFIPTPGIENCSHYYIVQKLIQERIRSIMMETPFKDDIFDLVKKYLVLPHTINADDEKMVKSFYEEVGKAVIEAFEKFESETPTYRDAILLLKDHVGKTFSIFSMTLTGIHMTIETDK